MSFRSSVLCSRYVTPANQRSVTANETPSCICSGAHHMLASFLPHPIQYTHSGTFHVDIHCSRKSLLPCIICLGLLPVANPLTTPCVGACRRVYDNEFAKYPLLSQNVVKTTVRRFVMINAPTYIFHGTFNNPQAAV